MTAVPGSGPRDERVRRASRAAALVTPPLGGVVLLLVPVSARIHVVVATAALVGTALAARRWLPDLLATARLTRALGAVPGLVGRLVLRLRLDPTVESAVAFAADGDGPLARSLAREAHRARGTGRAGLDAFADRWADRFPSLRRACSLVAAAASAGPASRERSLDRAVAAVREGTRERATSFAADLRGPATALYAFGVLLPLALVGVLPAAGVAGLGVSLATIVLVYDVLLPLGLLGAAAWLLARRPVAFPPPRVDRAHPAVPDDSRRAMPVGVAVGALGAALGSLVAPWLAPVTALGGGVGATLVVAARPVVSVHERVRAVERGLPDALAIVGRRVAEGVAVERAVADASERLDGATGEAFALAARRQRRLAVGIERAFEGEHGPLADLPSERLADAVSLLAVAGRQGAPAGSALVATADHVEDLREVEREARRSVRRVTRTLSDTAAVFGPLVGGVTVGLAGRLSTGVRATSSAVGPAGTLATADPLPVAGLGLAVGAYVCWLAVVLPTLATGLARGVDPALVATRVGQSLLAAVALYTAAFAATTMLT
ncbi:type II secretion system protein [Salinirubellus salinus]|uniref:Type II secretion system protein n=1 Tax=Salinirubellus salinus TaxID=1364945 RepID=A0A9E7R372_9EURY|nr:type II secretion system protein [Salinirubellus salinus]UWM54951.1 type II secretion system protein [Salinirubellus salinus]